MPNILKSKLVWQLTTALIAVLIIAPVLLNLAFIYKYGVNCVFWDQWEVVPLFDKLYSGNLSFADLFAQHNEHRILLPRLVMLGLGSLTHYNTVAEMYFAWFLLCLICFVLFKLFVRTFGFSSMTMAKFIPVVWLTFGLRQYDNLLWGFQFVYFMVVLFFLLMVYLLAESRRFDWRFGLAILCGLASTFSLAGGLLVWPIGLIQLVFTARTTSKRLWGLDMIKTATWAVAGIAVYILYFAGYTQPQHTTDQLYAIHDPLTSIIFGLVALGSPLSNNVFIAAAIGPFLLILYILVGVIVIFKPDKWPVRFPLLALVLFTAASAAVLLITRAEWGVGAAFVSRYTTTTVLGITGLYMLALSVDFQNVNLKYFLWGALLSLLMAGVISTDCYAYLEKGKQAYTERRAAAYYLVNYAGQSDENLGKLYPWPAITRERIQTLVKYKLNVFSEPPPSAAYLSPVDAGPLFYIEDINGRRPGSQKLLPIMLDLEDTITIKGWAVDQINSRAAGGIVIDIDNGRMEIPALYGIDRPDVAEYYKNQDYRLSGFESSLSASAIGPGRHIVSIKVLAAKGQEYYQPVKILTLDIK